MKLCNFCVHCLEHKAGGRIFYMCAIHDWKIIPLKTSPGNCQDFRSIEVLDEIKIKS